MTADSTVAIPFPTPNTFQERLSALLPGFSSVNWVDSTGSTNKDLGDLAREMVGATSWPRLLGAHLQTAGKGRAARPWHNTAGACLMFSCGFAPRIGAGELPGIAPALGIASCLAIRSLLVPRLGVRAAHQLTLKWPNDLLAADERRKAAKAFDTGGWVMLCGSFSKTVAPGMRLGWVEAGRWKDTVARLKRVQGVPTNPVLEHALADLLTQGSHEARLRRLCAQMKERLGEARRLVSEAFPRGTRVSAPWAGYTLWVELPGGFDTMRLFEACRAEGIIFGPGSLFTATDRFGHCLRLSFAGAWTDIERRALARIGELARAMGPRD